MNDRRPLRVGIVSHELPGDAPYGGIGRYLEEIVPAIQARGVDVQLFAPNRGARSLHLQAATRLMQRTGELHRMAEVIGAPEAEIAFERWLRDVDPDIVWIHESFLISQRIPAVCVRLGIPYVLHAHDLVWFCNRTNLVRNVPKPVRACDAATVDRATCAGCLQRVGVPADRTLAFVDDWRLLGQQAFADAAGVIHVSQALQDIYERDLGWTPRHSTVLWPAMRWPQPIPATDDPRRSMRFGAFGHLIPVKGIVLMLEAVRLLTERGGWGGGRATLHLHGMPSPDPAYAAQVDELLAQLDDVVVAGAYLPAELPDLFARTEWLLSASLFEASPLVIHEAAACNVPAIGPRIGGVPEKIGGGGLLFDAGDAASLADAIELAMDRSRHDACVAHLMSPPTVEAQAAQLVDLLTGLATIAPHIETTPAPSLTVAIDATTTSPSELLMRLQAVRAFAAGGTGEFLVIGPPSLAAAVAGQDDVRLIIEPGRLASAEVANLAITRMRGACLAFEPAVGGRLPARLDDAGHAAPTDWWYPPDDAGAPAFRAARSELVLAGAFPIDFGTAGAFAETQARIERAERRARTAPEDPASFPATIVLALGNHIHDTVRCLSAIAGAAGDVEVVIIDDATSDGTPQFLEALEGDVVVVRNDSVQGTTACWNQAALLATGEVVVFLDPQLEPVGDWLAALLERLCAEPALGAVGARVELPDGTISHGGITLVDDAAARLKVRPINAAHGYPASGSTADVTRDVSAVAGGVFAVRHTALRDIGPIDATLPADFASVDACLRLRDHGHAVGFVAGSRFVDHRITAQRDPGFTSERLLRTLADRWSRRVHAELVLARDGTVDQQVAARIFALKPNS